MEKTAEEKRTVDVFDCDGVQYQKTYLKRAKGLVKKGRAYFIHDNQITLVCPPKEITEDKEMEHKPKELNLSYILEKIDYIIKQGDELYSTLKVSQENQSTVVEDSLGVAVAAREETNRELISFLRKIYDDSHEENHNFKKDVIMKLVSKLDSVAVSEDEDCFDSLLKYIESNMRNL